MQTSADTLSTPAKETTAVLFSLKRPILGAMIIPPALAVLLVLVLPPFYRADTELLVKTGREYLPQSEDGQPAGPTATKQEAINSEIELLTSRAMAAEVIDSIGLKNLYPRLIESPPWFATVADAAIKKFQKNLSAEPIKMSNIIDVTFDADDPKVASNVLDRFVQIYLTKHTKVYSDGRRQGYEEIIDRDTDELKRLEHRQAQIKLDGRIYDIGAQRTALIQQRVDAESHLQDAIDHKATLEQSITALTAAAAHVLPTTRSSETDHSAPVDHARDALTDLRAAEAALAGRYAPDNPELGKIRQQIEALQSHAQTLHDSVKIIEQPAQLALQVRQQLVMDQVELAPLSEEIARYRDLIGGYGQELDRLERADTELRLIKEQIEDVQVNIQALRQRFNLARTEEELDQARMTSVVQIAPALTPDKPAQPRPLLFVAAGIVAGLLAAGGVMVLGLVTRRTFYTEIGLERRLGLPVLASVELVTSPHGQKLLSLE